MKSRFTTLAGSALVLASLGMTGTAGAADLTVQDQYTTTIIDKSIIKGAVRKNAMGMVTVVDNNGEEVSLEDLMKADWSDMDVLTSHHVYFDYSGKVVSVDTNDRTGELKDIDRTVGTIEGTAQFPMAFAMGSVAMKGFLDTMYDPKLEPVDPPQFPAVINWTCADCTMVVDGVTYKGIKDKDMGLDGRAFTGLGPVEVAQISPYSMTVRLAGCSAVAGDNGKVGTLCMNSSLTFDLEHVKTGDAALMSDITGKGTSNCTTVLHQPMM